MPNLNECLESYEVPFFQKTTISNIANSLNIALKEQYKINIVKWEPSSSAYPDYMLLGGDRGILAYVKYVYREVDEMFTSESVSLNSSDVLHTICSAISDLDRPVFFVYLIKKKNRIHVFFETDEQVRDRWLKTDFSRMAYSPVLQEAGTFNNLVSIFMDLKKNSVHFA